MTAFDYTRLTASATRMVERFGTTATLTRRTRSGDEFDATFSDTAYTIKAVMTQRFEWDQNAGAAMRRDELVISSDGQEPLVNDKVLFDGVTYTLAEVDRIAPAGGTRVAYVARVATT